MIETEELKRIAADRIYTIIEEHKEEVAKFVAHIIDKAYVQGSQDRFVELTTKRSSNE